MVPLRLFFKIRFGEAMHGILSVPNLKKAFPFILHFSLTVIVATGTIYLLGGNHIYNLKNRVPRFVDFDGGTTLKVSYKPLQSDMTTALTTAASATRLAAACWTGKLLWRCAFMFMEKGEITMTGFSKVVSGGITTRLSSRHVSSRNNVSLIYLIIFTCFFMDFFSSILTGSVTWQPAFILVEGVLFPLTNIPEGLNGTDITSYRNQPVSVSNAIERGAALALVSWGNINTNSSDLPIPSNLTRRAIIQRSGPQTIQLLNTSSMLHTSRLPYFKVEKFEYLTDPETTLTTQQKSLLNDSSIYNPYLLDQGYAAFLPDTYWGPGSSPTLPNATNFSESRILGIRLNLITGPNCPSSSKSFIPSNINVYSMITANSTNSSCFVFANVTYTAGAATCRGCKIASPTVVEGDINGKNLQPVPDPLTIEALAITPSVGTHILLTFFADPIPSAPTSLENYTIEFVSRAYQAAWSSLALQLGGMGPDNQTKVSFGLPASRPTVRRWRVYLWAGLHIWTLFCGIAFAFWHRQSFHHPWLRDPAMAAFQVDTSDIYKQGQVTIPKDPWDPDAEHPPGWLQLWDYDHDERPGQPRTVTLKQEDVNLKR